MTVLSQEAFEHLQEEIFMEEGFRQFVYPDEFGNLTWGIGRNVKTGCTLDEAKQWRDTALNQHIASLTKEYPFYISLDDIRKCVFIDMAYNLGDTKFEQFTTMIELVKEGKYEAAALDMLATPWAKQVGGRALKLSEMMKTGEWQ